MALINGLFVLSYLSMWTHTILSQYCVSAIFIFVTFDCDFYCSGLKVTRGFDPTAFENPASATFFRLILKLDIFGVAIVYGVVDSAVFPRWLSLSRSNRTIRPLIISIFLWCYVNISWDIIALFLNILLLCHFFDLSSLIKLSHHS